jgi:hypothetical protein
MAKLLFTNDELSSYFAGTIKHKAYNETVNISLECRYHAEGLYPQQMIEQRRPSENKAVKDYRQKIWKPITMPTWSKVITELNKIRRSSDWMVKYNESAVPPRIAAMEEETLQKYCEEHFPLDFSSATNWVFSLLLDQYLKDPNSVILVMPLEKENVSETDYQKPFPYVFDSAQVYDYVQGDYAVLKSTDRVIYTDAQGFKHYGDIFYIATTNYIQRYEEQQGNKRFTMTWNYPHNLGVLPAFRVKGLFKKSYDSTFVFKSRLNAMLPRLDEALREYGDLQAEVVQHIFSEKWETVTDDCPTCKGKGEIRTAGLKSETVKCSVCDGSGAKARGPYSTLQIRVPMAGEKPVGTPPAGYIQKDVNIVKIQDERVDKHEFKALSAINMEYLAQTPLNQSGTAKEVDKDALNNFVNAVAEDLVWVMDRVYFFINEMRYSIILPDKSARVTMLPYIAVPEKFDLLSNTYLEDQIAKQKEGKGNPIIINAMEEEYVNKKFVADHELRERILLTLKLDPLAGVSEDDRITRISQGGITKETYIISCNISQFIERALEEKGGAFLSMKLKEQKELLKTYAKEQIEETQVAAKLLSDITETDPGASQQKQTDPAMTNGG